MKEDNIIGGALQKTLNQKEKRKKYQYSVTKYDV